MIKPSRALSVLLAALMLFSLVSCGGNESSFVFEPIESDESGDTAHDIENRSIPSSVPALLAQSFSEKTDDALILSDHFSVSRRVFDVLFNYVIIKQLSPGDGDFDEYDYYFSAGLLDPFGSVQGQKIPGSDVYWLSDAASKTIVIVCEALHYFEFAAYRGISALSRINAKKVDREMQRIRDKEYGGTVEELFGDVSEEDIYLALILKTVYEDPSAVAAYSDYNTFPQTKCSYSGTISPSVSKGIKLAAEFFQQK